MYLQYIFFILAQFQKQLKYLSNQLFAYFWEIIILLYVKLN